ncbi:MAG: cbb3-type cytochrome oxidase assembly protein CcoS [Alphaproteobacteria bacterium]
MDVLLYLIPIALTLGGLGLAGFFWALRHQQFDDPEGDSQRALFAEEDHPLPPPPDPAGRNDA